MNKEEYWKQRPNNIGSKRPKPVVRYYEGLNRLMRRWKLNMPDIRNTKKHRDMRTAEGCMYTPPKKKGNKNAKANND